MLTAQRSFSLLDEALQRGDVVSRELAERVGAKKIDTLKTSHYLREDTDAELLEKVESLRSQVDALAARVGKLEKPARKKAG